MQQIICTKLECYIFIPNIIYDLLIEGKSHKFPELEIRKQKKF